MFQIWIPQIQTFLGPKIRIRHFPDPLDMINLKNSWWNSDITFLKLKFRPADQKLWYFPKYCQNLWSKPKKHEPEVKKIDAIHLNTQTLNAYNLWRDGQIFKLQKSKMIRISSPILACMPVPILLKHRMHRCVGFRTPAHRISSHKIPAHTEFPWNRMV